MLKVKASGNPENDPFFDTLHQTNPWAAAKRDEKVLRLLEAPAKYRKALTGALVVAAGAFTTPVGLVMIAGHDFHSDPFAPEPKMQLLEGGEIEEDIIGFKLAYLARVGAEHVFEGLVYGQYRADSKSRCHLAHRAPAAGCECGFYAFTSPWRARANWPRHPEAVMLTVRMYGDLVKHRHGWRSEEQVVDTVRVRPTCEHGSRAEGLRLDEGSGRYIPACWFCGPEISLKELSLAHGCPVLWAW